MWTQTAKPATATGTAADRRSAARRLALLTAVLGAGSGALAAGASASPLPVQTTFATDPSRPQAAVSAIWTVPAGVSVLPAELEPVTEPACGVLPLQAVSEAASRRSEAVSQRDPAVAAPAPNCLMTVHPQTATPRRNARHRRSRSATRRPRPGIAWRSRAGVVQFFLFPQLYRMGLYAGRRLEGSNAPADYVASLSA